MTIAVRREREPRLVSLLSEACELEHTLACSYLYAAFSLKRELSEGIDWAAQQRNRRWASQVYHVAAQEMLHLGQAWNLLSAVGGMPYYARPNFPLAARHYPLPVALVLRRCDLATIERFMYYETPAHNVDGQDSPPMPPSATWPIDESFAYSSVGELYGEVRRIIMALDEPSLFIRSPQAQVGQGLVDFFDIVRVVDTESACAAIDNITLQGEGTVADREDSHYGVFRTIYAELAALGSTDDVVRPVADNPVVRLRRDQIPAATWPELDADITMTEISEPLAVHALDLFDDVYVSMLQAMAYTYAQVETANHTISSMARASLELMTTVIKPLGEAICLLPSGKDGVCAGPTFAMSRHTQLPAPDVVTRAVFGERLLELADHARLLAEGANGGPPWVARGQVWGASSNLARIAESFATRG